MTAASQPAETPALVSYNVSLPHFSPVFNYGVNLNSDVGKGWNASYTHADYATSRENHVPSGVSYRRTQASALLSFTFEGSGMYLCVNPGGAAFTLSLDDDLYRSTTSLAADEPICENAGGVANTLLYATGLQHGSHTVKLQVAASPEREFRFYGGALDIGVQTAGKSVDDSQMIDDQDRGWLLAPGSANTAWDTWPAQKWSNGTATTTCLYSNAVSAAYKFSGAGGAVLLGGVWPDSRGFSVQLNDEEPVNLDATSRWWDGSAVFFIASPLDPAKEHTITPRNFNSDVPKCDVPQELHEPCLDGTPDCGNMCCASIDALRLLRASTQDPPESPQVTHRESHASVIVGAVSGALLGTVVISALACLLLQLHKRRRRNTTAAAAPGGWSPRPSDTRTADVLAPWTGGVSATPDSDVAWGEKKLRMAAEARDGVGNKTCIQGTAHVAKTPVTIGQGTPRLAHENRCQQMDVDGREPRSSGRVNEEPPQYCE